MNIILSLIISFVLFLLFFKSKHSEQPEKSRILLDYIFFILIAFVAVLLSALTENALLRQTKNFLARLNTFSFYAVHSLFIASCEEVIKFLCFLSVAFFLYRDAEKDIKSKRTAIKNASFVFALFFASFENIVYIVEYSASLSLRFFTASLIHIALALFYSEIIFTKKYIILILILIHASYNFSTYNKLLFFTLGFALLFICGNRIIRFFIKKS